MGYCGRDPELEGTGCLWIPGNPRGLGLRLKTASGENMRGKSEENLGGDGVGWPSRFQR